ncbi:MAG: hypothetical protein AAGJ83_03245 [Planctomycetota bacterium]
MAKENSCRDVAASGFVHDGYERLVNEAESEARRMVEEKYAEQWNSAGIFQRWTLERKMSAEIASLTSQMMPDVSPESLF